MVSTRTTEPETQAVVDRKATLKSDQNRIDNSHVDERIAA